MSFKRGVYDKFMINYKRKWAKVGSRRKCTVHLQHLVQIAPCNRPLKLSSHLNSCNYTSLTFKSTLINRIWPLGHVSRWLLTFVLVIRDKRPNFKGKTSQMDRLYRIWCQMIEYGQTKPQTRHSTGTWLFSPDLMIL